MSATLIYIIIFALLMFFMHRGHGGMGGCGTGHSHSVREVGKAEESEKPHGSMGQTEHAHH